MKLFKAQNSNKVQNKASSAIGQTKISISLPKLKDEQLVFINGGESLGVLEGVHFINVMEEYNNSNQ